MDLRVVNQKLDNLRNCIARIEAKAPNSAELLANDFDIQDIISINIERAVQSCIDIAAHIGADFDDTTDFSAAGMLLELAKHNVLSQKCAESVARAVGFRNLLVHRYALINWDRVHNFVTSEIQIFREFAQQIVDFSGAKK